MNPHGSAARACLLAFACDAPLSFSLSLALSVRISEAAAGCCPPRLLPCYRVIRFCVAVGCTSAGRTGERRGKTKGKRAMERDRTGLTSTTT